MKILISGIFGFLGSHLAQKLAGEHTVAGIYRSRRTFVSDGMALFDDLQKVDFLPDAIVLCHAAVASGQDTVPGEALWETNVGFTEKIHRKFPHVRTVYISSASVYGNQALVKEHSAENPQNPYAVSKLKGEEAVRSGNNPVIRFSSLYGEGMKENTLVPNYCNQAINNKKIEVWGKGTRFQNYIHVSDAVKLIEKTLEYRQEIDFPILGVSNVEYSNTETARIIAALTGSAVEYVNDDASPSFHYDNKLTQKVLHWKPEKAFADGIKEYLQWKEKQS